MAQAKCWFDQEIRSINRIKHNVAIWDSYIAQQKTLPDQEVGNYYLKILPIVIKPTSKINLLYSSIRQANYSLFFPFHLTFVVSLYIPE
jgi:hypothetical protein